mgnify:FL=1
MSNSNGTHIFADYVGFFPVIKDVEEWIIKLMESVIDDSLARRVHSHIEAFDGTISPPGFAAVVLLDESHLTAHCYSEQGLLAIDCFTCGATDTAAIIKAMDIAIREISPEIKLKQRQSYARFTNG